MSHFPIVSQRFCINLRVLITAWKKEEASERLYLLYIYSRKNILQYKTLEEDGNSSMRNSLEISPEMIKTTQDNNEFQ